MAAGKMKRMACYSSTRLEEEEVDIPEVPEAGYLVKVNRLVQDMLVVKAFKLLLSAYN